MPQGKAVTTSTISEIVTFPQAEKWIPAPPFAR